MNMNLNGIREIIFFSVRVLKNGIHRLVTKI